MKRFFKIIIDKALDLSPKINKIVTDVNSLCKNIVSIQTNLINIVDAVKMHQQALTDLYALNAHLSAAIEKTTTSDIRRLTEPEKKAQKPN